MRTPSGVFLSQHKFVFESSQEIPTSCSYLCAQTMWLLYHFILQRFGVWLVHCSILPSFNLILFTMCIWFSNSYMLSPLLTYMLSSTFSGIYRVQLIIGLFFKSNSKMDLLITFCDAGWVGCLDTWYSTTRFVVFLDLNLIYWHAKKQAIISCSSTEDKHRARPMVVETRWLP